ncbi:hypothetical protein HS088_TW08G00578 [Tripterygium wilfordii]|uniref:Late embryogenesis abundant protein n=1 Tax=Tripterygium wilfordii TaxID=458696 RepID=A0A7J7DCA7_TRIWF|nr:uncharacterized protein LOC120004561 [Tripterygium wilfordii]KAF5743990.1 hypothetical protein HS088_TW08G00578 [Tripterygium wilfordii]
MTRVGVLQARIFTVRGCSNFSSRAQKPEKTMIKSDGGGGDNNKTNKTSSLWVPHPRTGIYFPQGHEWVMDDVPLGAASFGHNYYWLRNVDGVEKPDADDQYSPT